MGSTREPIESELHLAVPTDNQIESFCAYLSQWRANNESYHNHKEAMGYGGTALYLAGIGTLLVADRWPYLISTWPSTTARAIATGFVLVIWVAALLFIKWQFRLRHLTAIQNNAIDRLLARLITGKIAEIDVGALTPHKTSDLNAPHRSIWKRILAPWEYLVWPSKVLPELIGANYADYPALLVDTWEEENLRGSEVVVHERASLVVGWIFTLALVAKTWLL